MREKEEGSMGIIYIAAGSSEGAVGGGFSGGCGGRERERQRLDLKIESR